MKVDELVAVMLGSLPEFPEWLQTVSWEVSQKLHGRDHTHSLHTLHIVTAQQVG